MERTLPDEDSSTPVAPSLRNVEARLMFDQLRMRMFGRRDPVRVGRFTLGEVLGRGAHGNVYLAEDAELKRRVAVKILRAEQDSSLHERLLREARALAQIKHPNVLTIHDVGVEGDRIFIAMEYVEEGTLAQWCRAHPPGSRSRFFEVLQLAIGAARGLAVAHEAGIVHRDVKPANILVGADGRPRLADFGVARAAVAGADEVDSLPDTSQTVTSQSSLTRTGAIVGTPLYMAPEQFSGQADPASDQWGLCATLWEAAYGERPYDAEDLVSLSVAVNGPPRATPKSRTEVPTWWKEILTRGLSPDPEARWPSVTALADALQRATTRQRRRRLAVAGVGVLAFGVVGLGLWQLDRDRRQTRCERGGDEIETVWNDDARVRVHGAMLATEARYAQTSFDHAVPHLERYTQNWRGTYLDLCVATAVDKTRSDPQWNASLECLDERREELSALVDVLSEDVDARTVENAVQAAAGLGRLEPCAEQAPLTGPEPSHQPVAELRRDYWSARALEAAGRYEQGRAVAESLLEQAARQPSVRMRARAGQVAGDLARATGAFEQARLLHGQAFDEALAKGEFELALEAAIDLASIVGSDLELHERGLLWGRVAQGLLVRLGREAELDAADLHDSIGSIYRAQGKLVDAQASHERALDIREQVLGPEHPQRAASLNRLGAVLAMQGQYDDAQSALEQGLALRERALGPDHPLLATSYQDLGELFERKGDFERAESMYRKAIEMNLEALGPEHTNVASARGNLAAMLTTLGRYDEAEQGLQAALKIRTQALGPEHPDVGTSFFELGALYEKEGQWDEGIKMHRKAIEVFSASLGPDHPRLVDPHTGLGGIYRLQGNMADAEREYLRAKQLLAQAQGKDASNVAVIENNLGNVYVAQGRFDEALDAHHRAIAIWEDVVGPDHARLGAAYMGLGVVHGAQGDDDEAEKAYLRAKELFENSFGPEHLYVAFAHGNLGDVYRRQGDDEAALKAHIKSAEIVEIATGTTNPELPASLARVAEDHLRLGQFKEAAKVAKRALDIHNEQGAEPIGKARLQFALAGAIGTSEASSAERQQAKELAEQAARVYRAAGAPYAKRLVQVEQWLAEQR